MVETAAMLAVWSQSCHVDGHGVGVILIDEWMDAAVWSMVPTYTATLHEAILEGFGRCCRWLHVDDRNVAITNTVGCWAHWMLRKQE